MNIQIYGTVNNLRAATAVAKEGAASRAEHVTVVLANYFLDIIEEGGQWAFDVRGAWVEIEQVDEEEMARLRELVEAFGA